MGAAADQDAAAHARIHPRTCPCRVPRGARTGSCDDGGARRFRPFRARTGNHAHGDRRRRRQRAALIRHATGRRPRSTGRGPPARPAPRDCNGCVSAVYPRGNRTPLGAPCVLDCKHERPGTTHPATATRPVPGAGKDRARDGAGGRARAVRGRDGPATDGRGRCRAGASDAHGGRRPRRGRDRTRPHRRDLARGGAGRVRVAQRLGVRRAGAAAGHHPAGRRRFRRPAGPRARRRHADARHVLRRPGVAGHRLSLGRNALRHGPGPALPRLPVRRAGAVPGRPGPARTGQRRLRRPSARRRGRHRAGHRRGGVAPAAGAAGPGAGHAEDLRRPGRGGGGAAARRRGPEAVGGRPAPAGGAVPRHLRRLARRAVPVGRGAAGGGRQPGGAGAVRLQPQRHRRPELPELPCRRTTCARGWTWSVARWPARARTSRPRCCARTAAPSRPTCASCPSCTAAARTPWRCCATSASGASANASCSSEEQYRAIFNASVDAMVLRSADFSIVDVNATYEAWTGYSAPRSSA